MTDISVFFLCLMKNTFKYEQIDIPMEIFTKGIFGNIYYNIDEKQIFCIKSVVLEKILV